MDFTDRLREELKIDEGCKYEVYLDHLGLPTFGIGHLITKDDPEYQMGMGTPVDEIRVNEVFEQDINVTIGECRRLFDDWDKLPKEVQLITANMMFNMGRPRLSQFKKMIQAIRDGDWTEAGNQMQDLIKQRQRKKHIKNLIEFFKPKERKFIKHG
jgi:lysozyme